MKKIKIIEKGVLERHEMVNTKGGKINCNSQKFELCGGDNFCTEPICWQYAFCPKPFITCSDSFYFICTSNSGRDTFSGPFPSPSMQKIMK